MNKRKITVISAMMAFVLLAGCGGKNPAGTAPELKYEETAAVSENNEAATEKSGEESKKTEAQPEETGEVTEEANSAPEDTEAVPGEKDYEALYAPVFEEVFDVLDYGFNIDREYKYVSGGLSEKVMYSKDDDLLNSIGYIFTDTSGDGIPELLIGSDEEYDGIKNSYIYTLCSIIDDKPICIISGSTRSSYNYMGDRHFYYQGSGGASITIFGENHLSDDGSEIVWDDFYFTDEKEDGTIGIYYNKTGLFESSGSEELNISEEEFAKKMNEYRDRLVLIDFTPIGKYRDEA